MPSTTTLSTRLLLEPAGAEGSGDCALCSIDPLTQVDHSAVITPAASDAVLIIDGVFAFRPELNEHWEFRILLEVDPIRSHHANVPSITLALGFAPRYGRCVRSRSHTLRETTSRLTVKCTSLASLYLDACRPSNAQC